MAIVTAVVWKYAGVVDVASHGDVWGAIAALTTIYGTATILAAKKILRSNITLHTNTYTETKTFIIEREKFTKEIGQKEKDEVKL